ncbi:MAG: hypothetical protein KatS3mg035_0070 [Bacteroidia bacterium]|nr:MAG: hypothetical protein KatS3mg035_0070 [Bacteroidia bacterium]
MVIILKIGGETLKFKPRHYFKPSSEEEIQQIVQFAKQNHLKIRIVGEVGILGHISAKQKIKF